MDAGVWVSCSHGEVVEVLLAKGASLDFNFDWSSSVKSELLPCKVNKFKAPVQIGVPRRVQNSHKTRMGLKCLHAELWQNLQVWKFDPDSAGGYTHT